MTTIENRRFALLVAGGVILFLLYQAWQKDFAPPPPAPPAASTAAKAAAPDETPAAPAAASTPGKPASATAAAPASAPEAAPTEQRISVRTDVFAVTLSTMGGDVRRVELLNYPFTKSNPDQKVALLDDEPDRWFVIQSGLTGPDGAIVSHKDVYRAASTSYALGAGDLLEVPLEFTDGQGRRVVKTYRFHRGSYVVDLSQKLVNGGNAPVTANAYVQLWRTPFAAGEEPRFTRSFMGVAYYDQKNGSNYRFQKIDFKKLGEEPLEKSQTGGWIGMLQHYFFTGVIPPPDEKLTFQAKPSKTLGYLAQYIGAPETVPPSGERDYASRLYIGPKLQQKQKLAAIAPGLDLTVDYGLLTPIAKPLFWLLDEFHKLTHNWGFAIILLTLIVKGALYPLSEAQYRSMAKMKKYAPRIQEIKERYGDDRERMHKAMMELYKKEKFNPLAGCWPIAIQMPIFLALYWVLVESVELRQADFALWIHDLTAPDPYFVLPVLFGITTFIQQRISGNVAADPVQQRVMSLMPVMMTVFFAFFPAGLVLYWFVSNLTGIGQQTLIQHRLTKEGLRR